VKDLEARVESANAADALRDKLRQQIKASPRSF
jgi:hypothetical protein